MRHIPTTLRSFGTAAACGVALAFSSCVVQFHTGRVLRDVTTERTGVDTYHPVDGKVYYATVGGKERLYMLAPEVTYIARYPSVAEFYNSSGLIGPDRKKYVGGLAATNVKPTGRRHWVEVSFESDCKDTEKPEKKQTERYAWYRRCSFVRIVDGLPKGAKVWLDGETFDETAPAAFFGTLSERKRTGSGVLTALSYPLSYVVDPVCTAIPTAVTFTTSYLGALAAMPVISLIDELEPHGCYDREEYDRRHPTLRPAIWCYKRGTSFAYSQRVNPTGGAPMLAEYVDKSRTYKLYAQKLTPEEARAAARKLQDLGIKVDVILYGDCTKDEMIRLGK